MRIFCPATLLLPHSCNGGPFPNPSCPCALLPLRALGPGVDIALGAAAAVYLSWSTGPRGRACRPNTTSCTVKKLRAARVGPDAPGWALVVCPARGNPGAGEPEQYAPDRVSGQIPGPITAGPPAGSPRSRRTTHPTCR